MEKPDYEIIKEKFLELFNEPIYEEIGVIENINICLSKL